MSGNVFKMPEDLQDPMHTTPSIRTMTNIADISMNKKLK